MAEPRYFWEIAIISGILKGLGWNSILYIASIASVDPALYESAVIDGAGRFRRMWYITLPSILGTIVIMMLFSVSNILRSDFDRIWMLQNSLNVSAGETIDTYVYKLGFQYSRFSYSTAVGLFQSVVGIVLIYIMNFTSTKFLGKGIFAKDN
jgi:putative aldouronate transport system permease protein